MPLYVNLEVLYIGDDVRIMKRCNFFLLVSGLLAVIFLSDSFFSRFIAPSLAVIDTRQYPAVFDALVEPLEMAAGVIRSLTMPRQTYTYTNPLLGRNFYIEPYTAALAQAKTWEITRPEDAKNMQYLASQPRAVWIGFWNTDPGSTVRSVLEQSASQKTVPVIVAYNVPSFSCEAYLQNPKVVSIAYLKWMINFAAGIGTSTAVIIVEPDALAGRDCLKGKRNNLIKQSVVILKKNPNAIVYIDAGHGTWNTIDEMSLKLTNAGIDQANGFALNVSNFQFNSVTIPYGTELSARVKNKHFVIDTSRNGEVPPPLNYEWCNPPGRALGETPTTVTNYALVDAFLWIKQPGESDGTCNGGPDAGIWWPEYALELVKNSRK